MRVFGKIIRRYTFVRLDTKDTLYVQRAGTTIVFISYTEAKHTANDENCRMIVFSSITNNNIPKRRSRTIRLSSI